MVPAEIAGRSSKKLAHETAQARPGLSWSGFFYAPRAAASEASTTTAGGRMGDERSEAAIRPGCRAAGAQRAAARVLQVQAQRRACSGVARRA